MARDEERMDEKLEAMDFTFFYSSSASLLPTVSEHCSLLGTTMMFRILTISQEDTLRITHSEWLLRSVGKLPTATNKRYIQRISRRVLFFKIRILNVTKLPHTLKKRSSSNFTELFDESRIWAIREQSVAQFSKLLVNYEERFRNNSKKFCNFLTESRRKRVQQLLQKKIHKGILKSFVEIKFEICNIYRA